MYMQKSKIEWTDYTINPVKGLCPMACSYCYARAMYKRFKWNPAITFNIDVFQRLMKVKEPSKVFVGSTMELFGDWVKQEWMIDIFSMCNAFKQHTFIFLTKQPQNLTKWSPFPDNCWVGVSVTSAQDAIIRVPKLKDIISPIKFISFEPLLKPIALPNQLYIMLKLSGINWAIIGQQTPSNTKTRPTVEWIREIIEACDIASIPMFLKNNLKSTEYPFIVDCMKNNDGSLRQELPEVQ